MDVPAIPQLHRVGYARVSSVGQNLDSQVDALQKAGCKKIFTDKFTGCRMDRPGWDQLMDYVRPGDALVVTELSRMTRSLIHLLETAQQLGQKQVNLYAKISIPAPPPAAASCR
jgi:DNA invertase Pin-like site-specific DNA recombinase